MYKGTAAFAMRNLKISLNSTFYDMKLVEMFGDNKFINIDFINV